MKHFKSLLRVIRIEMICAILSCVTFAVGIAIQLSSHHFRFGTTMIYLASGLLLIAGSYGRALNRWRQRTLFVTPKEAAAMVNAGRFLDTGEIHRLGEAFTKLNTMIISGGHVRSDRQYWDIRVMACAATIDAVGIETAAEMFGEMAAQRLLIALKDRQQRRAASKAA